MNKFSLYTLLILLFLGLSKSFAPSEQKSEFIKNERAISHFFQGEPLSVILMDTFQAGFLIKTYYMKLKIVHGFKQAETVIVRTSLDFWEENADNKGMSIFRRDGRTKEESIVPLPPGSLYIGNPAYGRWDFHPSGNKVWYFHRAYKHFPSLFMWGDFKATSTFYQMLKVHLANEQPFYGLHNEFGSKGEVTKQQLLSQIIDRSHKGAVSIRNHMKRFIHVPPWSDNGSEK